MTDGRIERQFTAINNSIVTMSGGSVSWDLTAGDNATINMTGGYIGYDIAGYNSANITMAGGNARNSRVYDDTVITISGGTIRNYLQVYENGMIYLSGDNFEVTDLDGKTYNLSYGSKLSDYGSFVDFFNNDYYTGTIKGTLSDGSILDNIFQIYTFGDYVGVADIVIIPEPATLSFLSLGAVLLKRKR